MRRTVQDQDAVGALLHERPEQLEGVLAKPTLGLTEPVSTVAGGKQIGTEGNREAGGDKSPSEAIVSAVSSWRTSERSARQTGGAEAGERRGVWRTAQASSPGLADLV